MVSCADASCVHRHCVAPLTRYRAVSVLASGVMHNDADIKELIPEFFYNPSFLKNLNGINLGTRGERGDR